VADDCRQLQHCVAIVTGGAEGIGRAVCLELARQGATVVVGYCSSEQSATETVSEIGRQNGTAWHQQIDVTEEDAVQRIFEDTYAAQKRVDILVNNAGIVRDNLAPGMSDEEWTGVIDTNLTGTFRCCRAVARYMIPQRKGKIVNIASISALKGGRGQVNYAAAKAGVLGLTRALALELAPKGICVNSVSPGVIETRMSERVRASAGKEILSDIALNRFGRTEDVARVVAFLCSPAADYITGANLAVCGGYRL
jgi:3-oxoacyl-[acyl-carrier protein] reductase